MDRRDAILTQLEALLTPLAPNFYRDRGELPAEIRPAIVLLDADEMADDRAINRGRLASSPNLVRLTPEIYIVLAGQKPLNATVGILLNSFRMAILNSILFDNTLQNIVTSSGEIRYNGCVTDLGKDRSMNGEMGVSITFVYPFIPGELRASS